MDLVEWKVRGLGAIRDQNLSMFWDRMPLRVAVYDTGETRHSKPHVNKQYFLLFELKNTWSDRVNGEEGVRFASSTGQQQEEEDEERLLELGCYEVSLGDTVSFLQKKAKTIKKLIF
jgi:hypothetical protein